MGLVLKKGIVLGVFVLMIASHSVTAQQAETVKLKRIQDKIATSSERIQVINFWATWCAPCVKEIPLFENLTTTRKDVEVTLVSIDLDLDPNPEKVYRFMNRKKLQSTVWILDEKDPNSWIDKIDKSWSGAIPATLFVNTRTGQRKFVERQLEDGDLERLIEELKTK